MLDDRLKEYLIPSLFNAAVRAGAAIMQVYAHKDEYDVGLKNDKTPVTEADRRSHETIRNFLGSTRIPILSEEGREISHGERCNWELFWLVDPLDGTVEFIKGNNEFTVNIALMYHDRPVVAAVYVPYLQKMYLAWSGGGSFLKEGVAPDLYADYSYRQIKDGLLSLPLAGVAHPHFVVAVSRSHQSPDTLEFIERLRTVHPDLKVVEQGSSYKFCLLAEGTVDLYVRTTPTYEWDTAAGELVLSEAGGVTRSLPAETPLQYNKVDLTNPWFVCRTGV